MLLTDEEEPFVSSMVKQMLRRRGNKAGVTVKGFTSGTRSLWRIDGTAVVPNPGGRCFGTATMG